MTTIIDAFVITLGLDPKNFNKGREETRKGFKQTKDDAKKTGDALEEAGKQGAAYFNNIKKEALGAFAAIVGTGALAKFTADTVTSLSAMSRAATVAGVKVGDLAAFRNMIVRNGGDAQAATSSIQNLAQAMEQFRVTGQSAMLPALNKIGAGRNDTALGVYEKFATWARGKDAKLVNYEGQQLGLDEGSINQALQGDGAYRAGMAQSYKLGVPTDEDIRKVTALQRAFFTLRQGIVGDAQKLLEGVAPALTVILKDMDGFVEAAPRVTMAILAIGSALSVFGSLKAAGWVLKLLGIGGAGAAVEGAVGAAAGGVGSVAFENGTVVAASGIGGPALGIGAAALGAAVTAGVGVLAYGGGMGKDEDRRFAAGQAHAYLLKHGYSDDQARGIAAGIYGEGGTATATNPTSGAYGIGQWLGSRKAALFAKYGPHPTLPQQLEFLDSELRGGDKGGASVRAQKTDTGTLNAYIQNFMRPGPGVAGDLQRGGKYLSSTPRNTTVTVGQVVINTKATDAKGIAKDFTKALAVQANSGLTP